MDHLGKVDKKIIKTIQVASCSLLLKVLWITCIEQATGVVMSSITLRESKDKNNQSFYLFNIPLEKYNKKCTVSRLFDWLISD